MKLFTIGFTKKSAAQFFKLIRDNQIKLLVDIRLNNTSQLAGFSKGEDLEFFLKELCDCQYEHCIEYAPTKDTLDRYKKKEISWEKYVSEYQPLMLSRLAPQKFLKKYGSIDNVCLLCSEPTPEQCHRRLLAEMIKTTSEEKVSVIHL